MSKRASDPSRRLPPNKDVHCLHAAIWIEIKATWGLSADQAEIDTLQSLAEACS